MTLGRPSPTRLRSGAVVLLSLTVLCLLGPFAAYDPTEIVDPAATALLPPASVRWIVTLENGARLAAESAARAGDRWTIVREGERTDRPVSAVASVEKRTYWLGTDTVGRDVLARVLTGGRVSLAVGAAAVAMALLLGIVMGMLSGLAGGLVDAVVMRTVDALLAVPMLFLLLLLAALFRPSLTALVLVLGASSWMGVARLVRGQVLSLKERDFVLAARSIGASATRIATAHLLPNTVTPLAQDASLRLGDLILVEAALSFLGLGVQPPIPSWGNMVAEGQVLLPGGWWVTFLPGLAIAVTVIGAALLADGVGELVRGEGRA
jgi:peptide/nickel transport system permease protein